MNFELTEEQELLRESLAGFLQRQSSLRDRSGLVARPGCDSGLLTALATELGLFGAALPEAEGGFGVGPVETMLIAEELGRALAIVPYVEGVVLASALLRGANDAGADALLAKIVDGTALVAPALYEEGARFNLADIQSAVVDGKLCGTKHVVAAAPIATHLLVSAWDGEEISLFVVAPDAPGVAVRGYALIDGSLAGDVTFQDAPAQRIGMTADASATIERAVDESIAASCAEAVGVLDAMLSQTIDYTRQREQFGVAIATFQVLQHRMADMATLLERARSMSMMATLSLGNSALERRHATSAAKAFISDALQAVGESAIQLHGGIGTTEEIALSRFFKRATVMQSQFGTAASHLRRMADSQAA